MTSLPRTSAGRKGMGGAGMTLTMVESASGAASAAAMKRVRFSAVAGRNSMPPVKAEVHGGGI